MSILIVDDSPVNRMLLEKLLEERGFPRTLKACSAMEAFEMIGLECPENADPETQSLDRILMDIMMPEIDGIEACRRLKGDPRVCDIPIIVVTAADESETLSAAFAAGAMDFIAKPIDSIELLARINSALALKREMDASEPRGPFRDY